MYQLLKGGSRVDSELQAGRAYVERLRAKGQTDAEISTRLQAGGWQPDLVRELFAGLGPPATSSAPTDGEADGGSTVSTGFIPLSFDRGLPNEQLRSPSGEFGLYETMDESVTNHILVLTKRGRIQWQAGMGRDTPLQCAVSDAGFVVVSADTETEKLTGDLFVFAPTGERILKKRLSACINCCGLSKASDLAWCITLMNPDNEAHSNKLFAFVLDPPGQLLRIEEPYGEIEDLRLVGNEVVVSTVALAGLDYRYSVKGKLLNEQEIIEKEKQARLSDAFQYGEGYALLHIVEARLSKTEFDEMPVEEQGLMQALLRRASECQISDNTKAKAQRDLGEMALSCGNREQAVLHFGRAVTFNPRVGVKKKLQALEKDLSAESERNGAGRGDRN